ncbi:unnamed protein product [Ambrosiozyma monospora]|uniref:Unnamed protein product n=1 Tax=Ambrosiozyma monospora TaxID=43982 RepID=A0A9W6WKS9_AMBMO|nr:unnamed protein product [Ambrosiozyma monospora]
MEVSCLRVWPLNSENNTSWRDKYTFGRNIVGCDNNEEEEDDDGNDNGYERFAWKVESLESQKLEAAKIVSAKVSPFFEWDSNDNLVVHQHTKVIKSYEGGEGDDGGARTYPVVFSSLPTFYAGITRTNRLQGKTDLIRYGDSETEYIANDLLDLILDTSIEIQYLHEWQEGDMVIVDNYQVSHGREPWSHGERKVLVSMWDKKDKGVFVDQNEV